MKADIQIDKGGHRYGKRYIERKRERRGQMDVWIRERLVELDEKRQ